MSEIGAIELVFLLLLLFIVIFGLFALKLKTPYPIVMVVGGLLLALVPGLPEISLDPDLIFLVVLPPLLYASAWTTSWRDFRYNFVSIFLLAFVLVGVTVLGVALIAPKAFAGFDWRLGLVLGAVVAPTDAIAATSIARNVGLPGRIVDILEGESLINDATGLLALQFATAIVVSRQVPTVSTGILTLIWLIVGGVGLGVLVAWITNYVERRIDDGPIEITLSILVPYTAYLAANAVHASGVLAVVTCGLILSRRSAYFFSPAVRIQIESFWESFTFLLNGLVFVLIGLQLRQMRAAIRGLDLRNACPGGRNLQRSINPAASFLELPRRLLRLASAHEVPRSEREETIRACDFRGWVDRDAGRGLSRRGPRASRGGSRRQPVPTPESDRFFYLLRHSGHAGPAGHYAAAADPIAWPRGRRGAELRRA